jgi:hypothetical protein
MLRAALCCPPLYCPRQESAKEFPAANPLFADGGRSLLDDDDDEDDVSRAANAIACLSASNS